MSVGAYERVSVRVYVSVSVRKCDWQQTRENLLRLLLKVVIVGSALDKFL